MAEYVRLLDNLRQEVKKFPMSTYNGVYKNLKMKDGTPRFIVVSEDYVLDPANLAAKQSTETEPVKKKEVAELVADKNFKEIPNESESDRFLRMKNIELAKKSQSTNP